MTNEEREALVAQGWTPPVAVDPDLAEADKIVNEFCESNGWAFENLALRAIKRGRELERAEAKPGMVWVKHDGSGLCPGDSTDAVMVQYGGGTCSYKVMAHLIHDWESVTHYAIITPPEDK
jgi:hypothetical protein